MLMLTFSAVSVTAITFQQHKFERFIAAKWQQLTEFYFCHYFVAIVNDISFAGVRAKSKIGENLWKAVEQFSVV
jgi:hypothetical protein